MSADHRTSERAYAGLKRDLLDGRYPGGRLQISSLTTRYDCSATPVREALLRLVGEHLVEMSSEGGFNVRAMSVIEARELYSANLQLGIAMTRCIVSETGAIERADSMATVMLQLAGLTKNSAVSAATAMLNDHLSRLRQAEHHVLRPRPSELQEMAELLRDGNFARLRRVLSSYHRKRLRKAEELVKHLLTQSVFS